MTPFQLAIRKARYGHRDWLVWTDRDGTKRAEPRNAATIKAAMLATGTQKCFTLIHANCGTPMAVQWWLGMNMLRNAKYYDGR